MYINFMSLKLRKNRLLYHLMVGLCDTRIVHFDKLAEIAVADFVTDSVADCVTDYCMFLSFKSVGKSFDVTKALVVQLQRYM